MHKQTYKHLSSEERDHIAVLRAQGFKASEIARLINRDKGTISREMRRNKSPVYDCYLPHKADERAKERKCKSGQRPRLKNKELMAYTIKKLKLAWSPETISGRWSKEHPNVSISHEAIYQFIFPAAIEKGLNADIPVNIVKAISQSVFPLKRGLIISQNADNRATGRPIQLCLVKALLL